VNAVLAVLTVLASLLALVREEPEASHMLHRTDRATVGTPAERGESRLVRREDGTYAAVPEAHGRTKIFRLVAREARWTLKPGLSVAAQTYDGVVPGPTLVVDQGDRVVIDYTNRLAIPDTIHLHGIHGAPLAMDGVAGISQPVVPPGGRYRYAFTADRDGTYFYHTHDGEAALNSGLYGGIIVRPAHPRALERVAHDDLVMISAWQIDGASENHFTLNGKEYPATQALEVRRGERMRIRWVNVSSENEHTMHTHGHDQRVIARDGRFVPYDDEEDTVLLGPGQRADVVVTADAQPGTWLVHCHFGDHVESAGMPAGLITAIHYAGTPNTLAAMGAEMALMPDGPPAAMTMGTGDTPPKPPLERRRVMLLMGVAIGLLAGGLLALAVVASWRITARARTRPSR
jgi:FtsP/CotA-like multicopper oxidase with cupredoxin domain